MTDMAIIKLTLLLISGPVFLAAMTAHIIVKIKLKPGEDSGIDDYHFEFEDSHPGYARYSKWSKITFIAAAASALLLFAGLAL